jgi:hypothetical protein
MRRFLPALWPLFGAAFCFWAVFGVTPRADPQDRSLGNDAILTCSPPMRVVRDRELG